MRHFTILVILFAAAGSILGGGIRIIASASGDTEQKPWLTIAREPKQLHCNGDHATLTLMTKTSAGTPVAGVPVSIGPDYPGEVAVPGGDWTSEIIEGTTSANGEFVALLRPEPGTRTRYRFAAWMNERHGPNWYYIACDFPDVPEPSLTVNLFWDLDGDGVMGSDEMPATGVEVEFGQSFCCGLQSVQPPRWQTTDGQGQVAWRGFHVPDPPLETAVVILGLTDATKHIVSQDGVPVVGRHQVSYNNLTTGANKVTLGISGIDTVIVFPPTPTPDGPNETPIPTSTNTGTPTPPATSTSTPTATNTRPPASFSAAIDCDVEAAGVQSSCDIESGDYTAAVVVTNISASPKKISAMLLDVTSNSQAVLDPVPNGPGVNNPEPADALLGVGSWTCAFFPAHDADPSPMKALSRLDCIIPQAGPSTVAPEVGPGASLEIARVRYDAWAGVGDLGLRLTLTGPPDDALIDCERILVTGSVCDGATVNVTGDVRPPMTATPSPTPTVAPPKLDLGTHAPFMKAEIDCDLQTAGVQAACDAVPGATHDVDIVVTNVSTDEYSIASFQFNVIAPESVAFAPSAPVGNVGHDSNPDFNEGGVADPSRWNCSLLRPFADGNPDPEVTDSVLGCFTFGGGAHQMFVLSPGESVTLATVTYELSAGEAVVHLENLVVGDSSAVELMTCNPTILNQGECTGATITVGGNAADIGGGPVPLPTDAPSDGGDGDGGGGAPGAPSLPQSGEAPPTPTAVAPSPGAPTSGETTGSIPPAQGGSADSPAPQSAVLPASAAPITLPDTGSGDRRSDALPVVVALVALGVLIGGGVLARRVAER